jgi:hypothetical protein
MEGERKHGFSDDVYIFLRGEVDKPLLEDGIGRKDDDF